MYLEIKDPSKICHWNNMCYQYFSSKWLSGIYYSSNQMLMSKFNIPKNLVENDESMEMIRILNLHSFFSAYDSVVGNSCRESNGFQARCNTVPISYSYIVQVKYSYW